jgi:sterol desaturase/sphingolipid hydroxylase (fatty acid hydroxylase superfamily)
MFKSGNALLFGFVPFAILLIATVEGVVLSRMRGNGYDWKAYFASLGDAVGRGVLRILPLGAIQLGFYWLWDHRLFTIPMSSAWSWPLLFLGQDFCYYWMHRADHRVRWLWATHAVHHSPNQMNLSVAYRLGWTQRLSGGALFFAPLIVLGFHPLLVVAALAANLSYQFWLHAEWIPRLGPLEWVLNTPSHHRVHHASNQEYLDANFGGVLIVFDRLFGTFVAERDDLPCRYGLTRPLTTHNPLKIATHEWLRMGRDVMRARSPRDVLRSLLGPPV